jgi:gamma-glutamyltranspeptidase/glutathione hydrolase
MSAKIQNAVASGHPLVTETAGEILRAGGNAFDAAIAAGFTSAIAEPALTSLGGGGFLLARTAAGNAIMFDFFSDTPGRGSATADLEPHFEPVTVRFPGAEQIFNVGLGSVAVPGNLRGFLHAHRRLGRLPLAQVLAPAIAYARDGIRLNAQQAYLLRLLEPIMTLMDGGRALFAPQGEFIDAGELLSNPALATFLENLVTDGDREFYEGAIADRIVHDMSAGQGQGLLTLQDLAAYRVIERRPLRADYRGFQLLSNPPPSFGGSLIALSLKLLNTCPFGDCRFGSPAHLRRLLTLMQEVERQRDDCLRDSLSDAALAISIDRLRAVSRGTTHISICDREGNVASMTTSNGEGSGYIVPDTGIMLNNMMGEDDLHPDGFHMTPAGIRIASMMSPSLLLQDGEVRLVLGSGGSKRIRTAILQVISNIVDFDLSLSEAVQAPRLHWDGECTQLEPGFDAATSEALREWGPVNVWTIQNVYFGGVHAVSTQGESAGDPRRGGAAVVFD